MRRHLRKHDPQQRLFCAHFQPDLANIRSVFGVFFCMLMLLGNFHNEMLPGKL